MTQLSRVTDVLTATHLMSLATRDADGLWAADVIFVHDDTLTLYWMSDPNARHSRAIDANGEAAGTITASTVHGVPNLGLQFAGHAQRVDGFRLDLAAKHYAKRGRVLPMAHEDVLQGRVWYRLIPVTLKLIDEERWGYEARVVART
jgi:uncharacterized protein